jgi:hypothetical protein
MSTSSGHFSGFFLTGSPKSLKIHHMPKERTPGLTAVSISITFDALARIDARAAQIGLSRSAYMGLMALQDPSKVGITIPTQPAAEPSAPLQNLQSQVPNSAQPGPTPAAPLLPPLPEPFEWTAEVYTFLLIAIPALEEYEESKKRGDSKPGDPVTVEIPPDLAESKLWRFFLLEREQILRLKWIESEKAGYDIGFSRAIQIWLSLHRALWIAGLAA